MAPLSKLRTQHLAIMPFAGKHLTETYVAWLNDPDVVHYSEQRHHRHTIESCRAFAAGFETSNDNFSAIEADGRGHIGNLVVARDLANGTADMSILIGDRAVWGRGYGAEAWGAVLRHILRTEGLRKVTAGTMAENAGMLAVMKKTGMTVEGRRERQFLLDEREVDMVYAAAFADTWREPET